MVNLVIKIKFFLTIKWDILITSLTVFQELKECMLIVSTRLTDAGELVTERKIRFFNIYDRKVYDRKLLHQPKAIADGEFVLTRQVFS